MHLEPMTICTTQHQDNMDHILMMNASIYTDSLKANVDIFQVQIKLYF